MKSPQDLDIIRDTGRISLMERQPHSGYTVKVSMSDSGIEAGSRTVLTAIWQQIRDKDVDNALLCPADNLGKPEQEPIVVVEKDGKQTCYVNIDSHKAEEIVEEHLKNGRPVEKFAK